jgi:alpha-1,2-mannosyltransferase
MIVLCPEAGGSTHVCFHRRVLAAGVHQEQSRLPRPSAAAVVAGGLACAAAVAWLLVVHLGAAPDQRLVDLDVYRLAGRAVTHGQNLYAVRAHPPQLLPFTYPPFAALLAIPLSWGSFTVVGWLWTVGEVATTVAVTVIAFRRAWPRLGRWWPLAAGLTAGALQQMLPLRDEIKFGQVDELLVLLVLLDFALLLPRRGGGILTGIAAAIKLTPAVFIVYLLVTGRRRAAAVALGTFAAATGLAAVVLPSDSRRYWSDALWHSERLRANAGTSNQSLRGIWLRAVGDGHTETVLWLVSVALVAVVGFYLARRAYAAIGESMGIAITGLLAVLLSPVSWIHHLCWLLLVVAAIVGTGERRQWLLAAAVSVPFVVPLPWIGSHLRADGMPLAGVIVDAYALLALLLVLTLPWLGELRRSALARGSSLRHTGVTSAGGPSS